MNKFIYSLALLCALGGAKSAFAGHPYGERYMCPHQYEITFQGNLTTVTRKDKFISEWVDNYPGKKKGAVKLMIKGKVRRCKLVEVQEEGA